MALPSLYDMLKDVLPDDHAHQSTARRELEARVAAGFSPTDILDLGCGVGATADAFASLLPNARWTGVDIETSPEVAQRGAAGAREFVTFDGVNLPFDDARFDLIFTHQVFEHVRHPEPLLAEVRRCLSADGLLIGQTSQMEPYHSFSFWNYTVHGFRVLLEDAGFRLLTMRPGIDSLTLIERALRGRPKDWSKWFTTDSPLNQKLEVEAKGRPIRIRNYRKLIYCGHFVFVAAHGEAISAALLGESGGPDEKGAARP